jgi:hypothetical protein
MDSVHMASAHIALPISAPLIATSPFATTSYFAKQPSNIAIYEK